MEQRPSGRGNGDRVTPDLFATPATVQALGEARAAAILIGGYDGSGNYGDIALADAALELVERLGPGLLAVPLLARTRLDDHRALTGGAAQAAPAIFYDPDGALEDDLIPVPAPANLAFGACYLYGGGYLNSAWGEGKLAMLRTGEALLEAGGIDDGDICRVASGLQVERGWITELGENDAATLRSFKCFGVRDEESAAALEALDSDAPIARTADDAVGLLRRVPPAASTPGPGDALRVNLHFAEHEWVSEKAPAVLDFYAGFVAELNRLVDRPLIAQPLIAYLDRHVDERTAVRRLGDACARLGVEVAEPLLLRPATLTEWEARLREGSVTLSCSYHVALTSLMLRVPAVLLRDSAYYAQKASGLAADFDLPAAFTPVAGDDPAATAGEVAAALPGGDGATALRERLAAGAERLRERRATAEIDLLGHLAGAALTSFGERTEELSARLRTVAAEPAELQVRLAELRNELEELQRRAAESPLDAELRAQEAEARAEEAHRALAAALDSRSWRMAAPLRRAGSLLRRR